MRGQTLDDRYFTRHHVLTRSIVALDIDERVRVLDLDDPAELIARKMRPSRVATFRRDVTQRMALSVFQEGATGISWWSTLEAAWTNVTLFQERAIRHVELAGDPRPLSTRLPEVRQAAEYLEIPLA